MVRHKLLNLRGILETIFYKLRVFNFLKLIAFQSRGSNEFIFLTSPTWSPPGPDTRSRFSDFCATRAPPLLHGHVYYSFAFKRRRLVCQVFN